MEHLPEVLIFIVAIFLFFLLRLRRGPKSTPQKPKPQIISEYDNEGYNKQGYNEVGRNRQGKYNRFYNVKCYKTDLYSEERFLNIRRNPLYITNYARERMRERMGINEVYKMDALAFEAYQFLIFKVLYYIIFTTIYNVIYVRTNIRESSKTRYPSLGLQLTKRLLLISRALETQ